MVAVDLVDQRQVSVPAPARELVHADRCDRREVAVRQPPVDRHADGSMDGVPGGRERLGDLVPRQSLGPPGEEPGVGVRHPVLAGGPGDGLDMDAAARARHAAHRVVEDDRDVPEGHEVEAPPRLGVVARGPAAAPAAPRTGPGAGTHPYLQGQPRVLHEPHRLVDERRMLLNPIQDSLELHPVPLPRRLDVVQHQLSRIPERDASDGNRERDALSPGFSTVVTTPQVVAQASSCTAPGFLDTRLRYAAWRSLYSSRASSGVRYASFSRRQHWL